MKTIYKYPLANFPVDSFTIDLPDMAEIIAAEHQDGVMCFWAIVDTANPIRTRTFLVYGTGHEISQRDWDNIAFVKTIQQGPFVWHIFEEI